MLRRVMGMSLISSAIVFGLFSVAMKSAEKPATPIKQPTVEIRGGEQLPYLSLPEESRAAIRFEVYRNPFDRNWVTPIGVVGHHRTLCVTFSGNIADLPESQQQAFSSRPPRFSWTSGLRGVFPDAIGLAVGKPANFWGTREKLRQGLLEGHLPVVISQGAYGDLHLEETAFATLPRGEIVSQRGDEPILAFVRIRTKNLSGTEQEPVIWVWRSGPVAVLGEIGGLTRKFEGVKLMGSKVIGDSGYCHLIFFPRQWELTLDSSADSKDLRYFGRLSTKLEPGETKDFWYIYPYWPLRKELADTVGQEEYEEVLSRVANNWKELYSKGMTVSVPDEKIGQAFDIALANTLLLSQKVPWGSLMFDSETFADFHRDPLPSSLPIDFYGTIRLGGYSLMCEDTAQKVIVHSLLQTGHFDYAREALESIFHAQGLAQPGDSFGQEGCLSSGNATAVGERGCACEWASGTGYSLWAAAEYYKYTHDANWIRNHREAIVSGLNWIHNERYRPDSFAGYKGLLRGMRVCDSTDTGYHPYNDIMSYWGMKEIVGVLASLGLGGRDWEDEVRDYEARIKSVYEKDDLSAYTRRSGEYGLATGAALMSGLYSIDSPIGRKLAAGEHAGWYGMYHGLFAIEEGDNERFLEQYYNLIATHMSHDTHANGEWPDIANPDDKLKTTINLQPHSHSNAGFHFMTRAMLIYEDDSSIHVLRGIPSWWLNQSDKSIDIRQAPTTSGPISFNAGRLRDRIKALIDLPEPAPDKTVRIYFPLPTGSRMTRVEINGKPWKQFDPAKSLLLFSGLSGRVEVLAFLQ